jgi:uncharacterized coiled-coil DUF342 family protein
MTERRAGWSHSQRRMTRSELKKIKRQMKRSYEIWDKVRKTAEEYHRIQAQQAEQELSNRLSSL